MYIGQFVKVPVSTYFIPEITCGGSFNFGAEQQDILCYIFDILPVFVNIDWRLKRRKSKLVPHLFFLKTLALHKLALSKEEK